MCKFTLEGSDKSPSIFTNKHHPHEGHDDKKKIKMLLIFSIAKVLIA
jgi:hypothetical protein